MTRPDHPQPFAEPAESGVRSRIRPRATDRCVLLLQSDDHGLAPTLELWGFRVETASTAEEASQRLAEGHCIGVLADLDMPGVDVLGLVAAMRLHPETRALPVLALARHGDASLQELARERGCDRLLVGSVDADHLAMELEATLAHPGRPCAAA